MRRLAALLIPLALCGCPEPTDHNRKATIQTDDPEVVAEAIRKELADEKFDRRMIREGPALKDYDQVSDVGPEMLWEVVGPYARLMEEMGKAGQGDSAKVMCQGILIGLRGYLDFPEDGESTGFYGDPAFAYACDVIVLYRESAPDVPPGVFDDAWWAAFESSDTMTNEIKRFQQRVLEARKPKPENMAKANWDEAAEKEKIAKEHGKWLVHSEWTRRLRWSGLEDQAQLKAANPDMIPDPK